MEAVNVAPPAVPSRTGVWVGIAAITMSFAAYTSAMLVRQSAAPDWQHFHLPTILYWNTVLLLASSGTLELARRRIGPGGAAAGAGARSGLLLLWLTLGMGLMFVAGQVVAWRELAAQGLFLATGPATSFFYVFTALHALHLLGGVVALAVANRRVQAGAGVRALAALRSASLYWHFMGVLWVYLLLILTIEM